MSAITHGMDVAAVRALATQMDQSADQIKQLMNALTTALEGAAWVGSDATQFKNDWQSTHVAQLTQVAAALQEAASRARQNAEQQEQASA